MVTVQTERSASNRMLRKDVSPIIFKSLLSEDSKYARIPESLIKDTEPSAEEVWRFLYSLNDP